MKLVGLAFLVFGAMLGAIAMRERFDAESLRELEVVRKLTIWSLFVMSLGVCAWSWPTQ